MESKAVTTTQTGKQDNVQDVIRNINEQYQDAYNAKNDEAIKALYTKDATRVSPNGHIDNGNEEIGRHLKGILVEMTIRHESK